MLDMRLSTVYHAVDDYQSLPLPAICRNSYGELSVCQRLPRRLRHVVHICYPHLC